MKRLRSRRPSASLLIATLALVVAVGGGGQAFADAGARISALINGKSIKKGTIAGSKLKKNTLTGSQIKESALGKVPSATSADTAASATNATNATHATTADSINGSVTKAFNYKGVDATTPTTVLNQSGYSVVASCTVGAQPVLTVTNNSAVKGEIITNTINQSGAATTLTQFAFNPGNSFDVINSVSHGTATFSTARVDGAVLTGQIFYDNSPSYGGDHAGCAVAGSLVVAG